MTGFLLIRHAEGDHIGRTLPGRSPGVHLNEAGRAQARRLAELLEGAPLTAVYSSPLERALETATTLAHSLGLEARVMDALLEVDFGRWSGLTMDELGADPAWRWWNESRSTARAPDGEPMTDVVARVMAGIRAAEGRHRDQWVAMVTHGDVVRAALAHLAGLSLDHMLRFDVAPASVTVLRLHPWGVDVLAVNRPYDAPWTRPPWTPPPRPGRG